ncbi:MAG TPA: hypothetical protein VLO07_09435 [Thermoanaerobaculia bacterium]|nr:hypothetical protein [Thermoanaerobaculia bacterium]
MSVLYLHFEGPERDARVQKLQRSGAHVLVTEPRWPNFFELAKKEKPYAIAVDFTHAPSHALETADYLAKAKETRDATLYLLHIPPDRLDIVKKRLPQAPIVTETELSERLVQAEREAQERAREKKEAAAQARKTARAAKAASAAPPAALRTKPAEQSKKPPPAKRKTEGARPNRPAPAKRKGAAVKAASRVPKKK